MQYLSSLASLLVGRFRRLFDRSPPGTKQPHRFTVVRAAGGELNLESEMTFYLMGEVMDIRKMRETSRDFAYVAREKSLGLCKLL